jgi:hypothetical protein
MLGGECSWSLGRKGSRSRTLNLVSGPGSRTKGFQLWSWALEMLGPRCPSNGGEKGYSKHMKTAHFGDGRS